MKSIFTAIFLILALSTGTAHAAGVEVTPEANAESADFVAGKKAIEAKKWDAAIAAFKKVVAKEPGNADAHNYLGYAYRWTNRMDDSFRHYREALKIDVNHRGANEYIGVAYLKVNQPDKARQHLKVLENLCGRNCEEYKDLAKAIAAYQPPK